MKAILLAAGLGKRMLPLTLATPKPLLSVGNTTLIEHQLHQLREAQITEVMINVHHLADQIISKLGDGSSYGLRIHYSDETQTLLDTGGGIQRVLPWFDHQPFLVMSSDIWTDYPIVQLQQKKVKAAHVVLVDNPSYHSQGDFSLREDGIIIARETKTYNYSGIAVLHPALFDGVSERIYPLSMVLTNAISKEIVTGEYYKGFWRNIGTLKELAALRYMVNVR